MPFSQFAHFPKLGRRLDPERTADIDLVTPNE